MTDYLKKFKTRLLAVAGVAVLALSLGGTHFAKAAQDDSARHHEQAPVWEEVQRTIKTNPANPAPADVLAQLVSLKVAYHDFSGRQQQGIIEVNKDLKDDVISFFKYAYYLNFPINEVAVASDPRFNFDDNKLMAANITSSFNYRTIAGTDRPSTHGLGRAFDVNPRQNPYITLDDAGNPVVQPAKAQWLPGTSGTLHHDQPLIQLMRSKGWTWGGDWTLQDLDGAVIDYQHLQKRAPTTAAPLAATDKQKQ
jgi:hypothetical protein